jgi:hypothetical protein
VDALVALGRSLQPEKKVPAAAAKPGKRPDQAATIEQIRSAGEFLSGYLDEHPKVLADEPDWMNDIARLFAHQAWRCPDQREELERLLDELSQKAPGYDRKENEQKFERCIEEAPVRAGGIGGDGPRTIASFFWWVRGLGWAGYPAITFRDFTGQGKPRASLANAVIAIKALGIVIRQDQFHHRTIVEHNGAIATIQEGILTDDTPRSHL